MQGTDAKGEKSASTVEETPQQQGEQLLLQPQTRFLTGWLMLLLWPSELSSVTQPAAEAPPQSHQPVTAFTKPSPESAAVETAGQCVVTDLGKMVSFDVLVKLTLLFSDADEPQPHLPVTAMTTKPSPELLLANKPAPPPGSAPKASADDQHPTGSDLFIQYRIKAPKLKIMPLSLKSYSQWFVPFPWIIFVCELSLSITVENIFLVLV